MQNTRTLSANRKKMMFIICFIFTLGIFNRAQADNYYWVGGKFTISDLVRGSLKIYDLNGNLVMEADPGKSASSMEFDLSDKPEGIYLVQLITDSKVYTQRIVVQQ